MASPSPAQLSLAKESKECKKKAKFIKQKTKELKEQCVKVLRRKGDYF